MTKLLIATGNEGKKKEMLNFFSALSGFEFLDLNDFPNVEEPEEDGADFEANALIKAQYYAAHSGMMTLAEDSGFILKAFPEKFGLRTRREFEAKDDMDWLTQFMDMMDGIDERTATFYSAMAIVDPATGFEKTVIGKVEGEITDFPQAPIEKGIPVSAVFIPAGEDQVFSAMTKADKIRVSHRGQSAVLAQDILKSLAV